MALERINMQRNRFATYGCLCHRQMCLSDQKEWDLEHIAIDSTISEHAKIVRRVESARSYLEHEDY